MYLFAYAMPRLERACQGDVRSLVQLVGWLVASSAALDVAGQVRAHRRSTEPPVEPAEDEGRIAVLDLGPAGYHAATGR